MTSQTKKKPPLVAILAVLVPLLALAVGALVTTSRPSDEQSSSTTVAMDGDPAAERGAVDADPAGDDVGEGEPVEEEGAAADGRDEEDAGGSSSGASTGEVASAPQTAGPEGDRPVVTWPQPTVPEGGCDAAGGSKAVIVLRDAPRPGCVRVGADQAVEVQNRTGREISFMGDNLNEIIPAGRDFTVGRAADAFPEGRSTFWVQGAPGLSGIIQVG